MSPQDRHDASMPQPTCLILASASPRRRELLARAGYRFEVSPPEGDGPAGSASTAAETAVERARAKARAVAPRFPGRVVLAADTVVVLDGDIIGKPKDAEDARRILRRLRGTRHSVVTGVVVHLGDMERAATEATTVVMRAVADEEIDAYVATGEALGKAGAYAVQERGDRFIERLQGSYTNVVGLPMELVSRMLAEAGITPAGGGTRVGGVVAARPRLPKPGSGHAGTQRRKDRQ